MKRAPRPRSGRGADGARRTFLGFPLVVVLGLALVACTGRSTSRSGSPAAVPPGAEGVALRGADVPDDVKECGYSAPMVPYLRNIRELNENNYNSVKGTWARLQAAGAVEGYVAVYAESPRVCGYWITGPPPGRDHDPMRLVSSIVVKFKDIPTAEAAYRADIFGQSKLAGDPTFRVEVGPSTRLGPNSVVGIEGPTDTGAAQAVWQTGLFNVFLATRNLTGTEVNAATSAVNRRAVIGA